MTKGVPPKELVEQLKRNRSAPNLDDSDDPLPESAMGSPNASYELPNTLMGRDSTAKASSNVAQVQGKGSLNDRLELAILATKQHKFGSLAKGTVHIALPA